LTFSTIFCVKRKELAIISDVNKENQAIAWFLKSKEKNPPKQETIDFLEMTVQRVEEKPENQ
jgi:hypothetical protein